jgi:hypothetical protein
MKLIPEIISPSGTDWLIKITKEDVNIPQNSLE